jgi:hypothetical protein
MTTNAATSERWPTARLDPVARLRILASAAPTTVLVERTLEVPFEQLWPYVTDFERSVPQFDSTVGTVKVHAHEVLADDAETLAISASMRGTGARVRFDVRVEPGFCLMVQPRGLYVVGMAASPVDAGRVRYAHFEGVPRRGGGIGRRWLAHHVTSDIAGIARALGASIADDAQP